MPTIPLSAPSFHGNEWEYVKECLDTGWVSSVGPIVGQFERRFAESVGARHAVACSSGTAALHVAMRLVGVAVRDEVFVSTLTFAASANAILYERAIPVLVDAETATWNLDPGLVVDEIARRARAGLRLPRAVEVVHVLGHPANIEPILAACEEHDIPVIEDAAEALGASYVSGRFAGRQVGTIGRVGCFSFNGNKVITSGAGGMIVTDDPDLAARARHLTTQAKCAGLEYRHDAVGYNYRMPNICAALGLAQLEQLDGFLAAKRRIAARYDEGFRDVVGVTPPPRAPWASPSMWLYSILIDERERQYAARHVIDRLQRDGVEARPLWTPLHLMDVYAPLPRLGGGVAERIFDRGLSLPSSISLEPADQDRVIQQVKSCE